MKKVFVISDVHLKKMASPTGEAILFLVEKARKEADVFLILGDLFDFWVGEGNYFKKKFEPLVDAFKELRKTCRLIYFEGNHDIHLHKFWENEMGFEIYSEPQRFEFNGVKVWAEHGDQIDRNDRDYLFLRWFLRTKPMEFLAYHLPSNLSAFIGERASSASRQYTEKMENKSVGIVRNYAQKLAELSDFDLILVGHTHEKDDFTFFSRGKERRLLNLGSWFQEPCYLQFADREHLRIETLEGASPKGES